MIPYLVEKPNGASRSKLFSKDEEKRNKEGPPRQEELEL
jgi:hypothetical protein